MGLCFCLCQIYPAGTCSAAVEQRDSGGEQRGMRDDGRNVSWKSGWKVAAPDRESLWLGISEYYGGGL